MNVRHFAFFTLTVSVPFAVTCGWTPAAQSATPRLKDEFFEAVARMETLAATLNVHARVDWSRVTEVDSTSESDGASYEVACRGNDLLLKKEVLDEGSGRTEITCRNESYFFVIEQSPHGTQLVFIQQVGGPHRGGGSPDELTARIRELGIRMPISGFHHVYFPLWEVVEMSGFEILDLTELDQSLVRVDHTTPPSYEPDGPPLRDAYVICDREQGWAVIEAGHRTHWPDGDIDRFKLRTLDYSTRGGLIFVNARRSDVEREDGSFRASVELTSTVLNDDPPLEVFYLSHYGLPEPSFDRPWSPLRISLLFLLLSVICVICWLMMSRRGRSPTRAA